MSETLPVAEVSVDLLHRYNVQGPRYTSYPTAPVWREGFSSRDYEEILSASGNETSPANLSLYVHLPFCESRFIAKMDRAPGEPAPPHATSSSSTGAEGRRPTSPPRTSRGSPGSCGSLSDSRRMPRLEWKWIRE